jgi:hypothetical protein
MKSAVLFIAIVAAGVASLSGSPAQSSPTSKPEVAPQPPPANPSLVTVVIDNAQPRESKHPQEDSFPEWALVIVGIITAAFICWQAWESRKAAQAMRDSIPHQRKAADAALLNAQALINSERPWVMIQIKELPVEQTNGVFDLRSFQFTVFNYGKSPAHIVDCKGPKIEFYGEPDKDLPIPPNYGTWQWERRFLPPNDSLPLGRVIYPSKLRIDMISEAATRGEHAPKGELVAYGLLEYTDAISGVTYKTAFCYRHDRLAPSSMGGHFMVCGPQDYNLYV